MSGQLGWDFLSSHLDLELLRGQVLGYTNDKEGCTFLISIIQYRNLEAISLVYDEIIGHISQLMVHPFASSVVMKLIEVCNGEQWLLIFETIISNGQHFVSICYDNHGSRVVMKLLERTVQYFVERLEDKHQLPRLIFRFVQAYVAPKPGVVGLARDINAHQIILYCLKTFPVDYFEDFLFEVEYKCLPIALDKTGCCVLKECVDKSVGQLKHRLLSTIIAHAPKLVRDPYGNHVVQHVLGLSDDQPGLHIVNQLKGSFVELAFDRFGSQVMIKCLTLVRLANMIILELVESPRFSSLMVDPYGSSVVMTALSVSKKTRLNYSDYLKTRITSNIQLKDHVYWLPIWEKFERLLM